MKKRRKLKIFFFKKGRNQGVAPATPKGQKKKKRKKWVWDFGGGRTTPKGLGVASATPYDR
jgi:hypothetical protein